MRMRRTLTKVLCITLIINVTFLMFVMYSRYTRVTRRQMRSVSFQKNGKVANRNVANAQSQKHAPFNPVYFTMPRHDNDVHYVPDRSVAGENKKYHSEYSLRREWKVTEEKLGKRPARLKGEPSQLFNVRKSQHGAHCAEFLQKPVWFVRPPGNDDGSQDEGHTSDHWQAVSKSSRDFYVFSAHYDVKGTTFWDTGKAIAPLVRIIGVSRKRLLDKPLFCQMWFNQTDQLRVEQAILSGIPEGHDKNYSAVFFLCPLWIPGLAPYAVSLVTAQCSKPYNLMYVHESPRKQLPAKDFTVCVSPLNRRYNRVNELVQMVEFNRLFGADYFVFYNFSTGPNIDKVLNQYAKEGLVQIVQWHLPLEMDTWPQINEVEIHYFGQLAALNDCLYRNMHSSKFLVFSDMDELIVPRKHKYWSAMLDALPETSVYHFRCSFFRRDWPESSDNFTYRSTAKRLKLDYLFTLDRESAILPIYSRSKFILEPGKVEIVGIHNIWAVRSGAQREHIVDPMVGLLHHYRKLEQSANQTHDPAILDFAKDLVDRVKERWLILQNMTIRESRLSDKNDL